MTIEELLKRLEAERETLAIEYRDYYEKSVEIKNDIKRYYEDPFVTPDEVPYKLIEDFTKYSNLHTATVCQHNRILSVIKIIKEMASG